MNMNRPVIMPIPAAAEGNFTGGGGRAELIYVVIAKSRQSIENSREIERNLENSQNSRNYTYLC